MVFCFPKCGSLQFSQFSYEIEREISSGPNTWHFVGPCPKIVINETLRLPSESSLTDDLVLIALVNTVVPRPR